MNTFPDRTTAGGGFDGERAWTLVDVLTSATTWLESRGEGSRLDAELLLSDTLGLTRIQLYTNFDKPLTAQERERFKVRLRRKAAGEPVAYILGWKDFMRHRFRVTRDVLIPRPDTETLVELAIAHATARMRSGYRILDVGTGSGCIAVSLGSALPDALVEAWDVSDGALAVAQSNAETAKVANLRLHKRDMLSSQSWQLDAADAKWDLIVSNPPYLAASKASQLDRSVVEFEPGLALFGGDHGLDHIEALAMGARECLSIEGRLMIEIAFDQAAAAGEVLRKHGWRNIAVEKDLERRDRVLVAQR